MKETPEELRQRIGHTAYQVTQNSATEHAFTGKYDDWNIPKRQAAQGYHNDIDDLLFAVLCAAGNAYCHCWRL